MSARTLLFLVRRDLLKDWRVLALVLLAVGSGALAIVPLNSLLEGFTASLSATTVDVSVGHVQAVPGEDERFVDHAQRLKTRIEALPGVRGVSVRLLERALAVRDEESEPLSLKGIDPRDERRVTTIAEHVTVGRFLKESDREAVVLGEGVASKLGLRPGDTVFVALGTGGRIRLTVQGLYSTGLRDLDSGGYMPLKQLQNALGLRDRASELVTRLDDESKAGEYGQRIEAMDSAVTAETWRDRMAFIGSLRGNMSIIQTLMVVLSLLAAGIAITVLMYTSIQHKVRSIGILKAIGVKDSDVLRLYLLEGAIMGIAGAVVGDLLGSAVALYLSNTPMTVSTGAAVGEAGTSSLTAVFSLRHLLLPSVNALVVTLAASLYPAWKASKINIMEAIWHE